MECKRRVGIGVGSDKVDGRFLGKGSAETGIGKLSLERMLVSSTVHS
jgi:hypothetical protein